MTYCKIGDTDSAWCAHCRGLLDPEEQARREEGALAGQRGWTLARYGGRCCLCGAGYEPGSAIRRVSEGWAASCCEEPPSTSEDWTW